MNQIITTVGVIHIENIEGKHIMCANLMNEKRYSFIDRLIMASCRLNKEWITAEELAGLKASEYLQIMETVGLMLTPLSEL